ncbi:MAG: AsmA-like C-terminal region-containing protein [Gemmataceae bacterium]
MRRLLRGSMMTWRKWIVRGLVVCILGGLTAGTALFVLYTNPTVVRQIVRERVGERFVRVAVQIGTARLRLLGGVLVNELRLSRSDQVETGDFLYVPNAVIFHDKEQMLDGRVAIRQVELNRPQFRLIRERDGRFNVSGILGPINLKERLPTVVVRGGTVTIEDRGLGEGGPLLQLQNVELTLINDPLPLLHIEGTGHADLIGPVRFRAAVPRATMAARVEFDLPGIPIGNELLGRITRIVPELAGKLGQLTGRAELRGQVALPGDGPGKATYDCTLNLRNGRFRHDALPVPLENLDLAVKLTDGVVPQARLRAASGTARLDVQLRDARLPAGRDQLDNPLDLIGELDAEVTKFVVTDAALAAAPADLAFVKPDFSPSGPLDVRFRYRKATARKPVVKEWTIEPQGMSGAFVDFAYPVRQVRGAIVVDVARAPLRNIHIDLTGQAGETPVSLRGSIKGEKATSEVILDISGRDLLLDDSIYQVLPARVQRVAQQFLPQESRTHGLASRPMGKADIEAQIRRSHGEARLQKQFTVTFKRASVLYDKFPYPLENVSGVLVVHPDHWECKGFRGFHAGGEILVDARSFELPGGRPAGGIGSSGPERVKVRITGRELLLDGEFEKALAPISGNERVALQQAWKKLRLAGRLSFSAEVVDDPGQPQNIDVSVDVRGCTMKPEYFDYALEQVAASVRYRQDLVTIRDLTARHGPAEIGLRSGVIQVRPDGGGFTAWLQGLTARGLVTDDAFLQALPDTLQRVAEAIRLRSPVDLAASLTLVAPPGPTKPLEVWWEGAIGLNDAALRAGVTITGATGQVYTRGYHDGRRLRGATGQLKLDRATVLGQPLTGVQARLDHEPGSPEVLRVRDLRAGLFGGTLTGQARVDTSGGLRYDVLLEAIGVQLELLGRHNLGDASRQAQLQGPLRAALHLTGEGKDIYGVKGNGRVDIPEGKMGQLPVLLDLVKAFGLRVPDRTAFEQAHMLFGIEGPQLAVRQLDLYGNAISLRGQGNVDLDGNHLNLEFTATPGRVSQILPVGFDAIPQAISQQFFKIKMHGKLGKDGPLRFDKELIPAVVEPLRRAIGGG